MSTYHLRSASAAVERPDAISRRDKLHNTETRLCQRCGLAIYGVKLGNRRIHQGCKTPEELDLEVKRATWKANWRARRALEKELNLAARAKEKTGRKPSKPLDPTIERPEPLLVVTKPLSLSETLHRYVASVLVECKGDVTATRRTLGISAQSLRRCIARIEAGTVKKCEPVREMRDYRTGTK